MNYPIIYDKFETSFSGYGLAILENATNVKVSEKVNGEYLLTLILPRTDPKWQYIQSENFILVDGQKFRIRKTDEIRDKSGKLSSNVQCEHVFYDANDCKFIPFFQKIGADPRTILEEAFAGTRFTIGTVQITTLTDIELSKTNPAKITQELIKNVGGELLRDNWSINLLTRRGNNNGLQIRVGKNMDSIKRTIDSTGLITRLYPYGKEDLDITSVNGGISYLDSPLAGLYDRLHIDFIDYKDVEDPSELKTKALAEFSNEEKDGIDKPKATYELEVQELKKLSGYRFVTFALGDTIRAIDETLNIDINARILEYEYFPFEAQKSKVVLGNFRDNLGKFLADLERSKQHLSEITDAKGNIKADWLENIISKLTTEIQTGLSKKAVVHDYGDIWVDNIENPTKAMGIVNGMFAIANSKKVNGDWNWRTFGNGDGFTADLFNAGKVRAANIATDELIVGSNITMGPLATLGWSQVTDQPTIISQDTVTQISRNEIATATIRVNQLLMGGDNGSISFNSLADKPTIPTQYTDAQALAAWVASGYKTYIDSNGVYTGSLTANQVNAVDVAAQRLRMPGNPSNYGQIGGAYGDLILYYNNSEFFRIYNEPYTVTLKAYNNSILAASAGGAIPLGSWNFSNATVSGLNVTAKFA